MRSEEKAKNSKKLRNKVQTVIGQLDYLELIKEQVRATEILNNTANTDHVSSAEVFRNAVAASGTVVLGERLDANKRPKLKKRTLTKLT